MSCNAEIVEALRRAGVHVSIRSDVARQGTVLKIANFRRPLRLYSWHVTDNGAATGVQRPADERRIQASTMQPIDMSQDADTLVLGWADSFTREPLIVAFNPFGVAHRVREKIEKKMAEGKKARPSDSQQFRQRLLDEAIKSGAAMQQNQHGEFVIAIRPRAFAQYVQDLRPKYHGPGTAQPALVQRAPKMEDLVRDAEQSIAETESNDDSEPLFDAENLTDARERLAKEIVVRRGQPAFRRKLLKNYGCCVVTGSRVESILEAAHIVQYSGPDSNHISNGLLLRADVHTLFDLGLISVEISDLTIIISPRLGGTEYAAFAGKALKIQGARHRPDLRALALHRAASAV
jgi:hypothetical protein